MERVIPEDLLNQTADASEAKAHGDLSQVLSDSDASADDIVGYIQKTLTGLQDSFAALHIGLQMQNQRIAQLEKYVAYLLEKDPYMGEKIRAGTAAMNAEKETPSEPTQA